MTNYFYKSPKGILNITKGDLPKTLEAFWEVKDPTSPACESVHWINIPLITEEQCPSLLRCKLAPADFTEMVHVASVFHHLFKTSDANFLPFLKYCIGVPAIMNGLLCIDEYRDVIDMRFTLEDGGLAILSTEWMDRDTNIELCMSIKYKTWSYGFSILISTGSETGLPSNYDNFTLDGLMAGLVEGSNERL